MLVIYVPPVTYLYQIHLSSKFPHISGHDHLNISRNNLIWIEFCFLEGSCFHTNIHGLFEPQQIYIFFQNNVKYTSELLNPCLSLHHVEVIYWIRNRLHSRNLLVLSRPSASSNLKEIEYTHYQFNSRGKVHSPDSSG